MKFLTLPLVITFIGFSAFAGTTYSKKQFTERKTYFRNYISKSHKRLQKSKLNIKSVDILKFAVSPAQPKVGENITLFVQPLTNFTDTDMFVDFKLDGIAFASDKVERPTANMWILSTGPFTEVRPYAIQAKIFIQDHNATLILTEGISNLEVEISDLNAQILAATDPLIIADLSAQRDDRIALKDELLDSLASLKTELADEEYVFSTYPDSALSGYPVITSTTPSVLVLNTSTNIAITGSNFSSDTGSNRVRVGGQLVSILSESSTAITVAVPALTFGSYDLEISSTTSGVIKNLIVKDALFVTETTINHSPSASVSTLALVTGQIRTRQISVTDADGWQTFKYAVTKSTALGATTVSPSGLITFTAGVTPGTDTIEVTVTDSGFYPLSTVVSLPITLTANTIPTISGMFIHNRSHGLPIRILMQVQGVSDTDGAITEIKIDMGDGTFEYAPVSGPNFALIFHNYHAYGNYNATTYIKDDSGAVRTYPFTATIMNTDMPVVKFALDKFWCAAAPCSVTADATDTTDADGISTYRWLWGDGSYEEIGGSATHLTRTHSFGANGTYRMRLRARDPYATQGEAFATVYVGGTEPATGSPSNGMFTVLGNREILLSNTFSGDASRSFDPNPSGSITNYAWNLNCAGCSAPATGLNYIGSFDATGIYYPELKTTNALGGVATAYPTEIIAVNYGHAPRGMIRTNGQYVLGADIVGIAPFTAWFSSVASYDYDGTITNTAWAFGDGTDDYSNSQYVTKVYSTPGVYYALVRVIDNDGNASVYQQRLLIAPSMMVAEKLKKSSFTFTDGEQIVSNACGANIPNACRELAKVYRTNGNSFVANELVKMAARIEKAKALKGAVK